MKDNKKAQVKMMETISVLIVFIILMVFVLFFYISMSKSHADNSGEEESDIKAVEISQIVTYMPEFQCSNKNIIEDVCFDVYKVLAFKEYRESVEGNTTVNTRYYDLLKDSEIVVREIYPTKNTWVIYNRTPSKSQVSIRVSNVPISLYNPVQNKYSIGMLVVSVFR